MTRSRVRSIVRTPLPGGGLHAANPYSEARTSRATTSRTSSARWIRRRRRGRLLWPRHRRRGGGVEVGAASHRTASTLYWGSPGSPSVRRGPLPGRLRSPRRGTRGRAVSGLSATTATASCGRCRRRCRSSRSSRSWRQKERPTPTACATTPAWTGSRRPTRWCELPSPAPSSRPSRRRLLRPGVRRYRQDRGRRPQGVDLPPRRTERHRRQARHRRTAGSDGPPLGRRARARPHRDPHHQRRRPQVREHARPAALLPLALEGADPPRDDACHVDVRPRAPVAVVVEDEVAVGARGRRVRGVPRRQVGIAFRAGASRAPGL